MKENWTRSSHYWLSDPHGNDSSLFLDRYGKHLSLYQFFSCCCQDEFQEYLRSEENYETIDRILDKKRYSSLA